MDSHAVIVRGRIRYEAALRLGMTEVPVAVIPDPIPTDPWAAIRRYDNEIPEPKDWESEWNLIRLEDLKGLEFDLSALGFGDQKNQQWSERKVAIRAAGPIGAVGWPTAFVSSTRIRPRFAVWRFDLWMASLAP